MKQICLSSPLQRLKKLLAEKKLKKIFTKNVGTKTARKHLEGGKKEIQGLCFFKKVGRTTVAHVKTYLKT